MMKSKLKNYAMALMLGMGLAGAGTAAHAGNDVSVFADIGAYSQYIWRGAAQGAGEASIQGDVGVDAGNGLSANVWFATGVGTDKEYDVTVDYSGEAGDIGYSVGIIRYDYIDAPAAAIEVYLGASMGAVSATAYAGDGYNYVELGAGDTVADLFDASVAIGYETNAKTTHATLSLSKDIDMGSYTLSPSVVVGNTKAGGTEAAAGFNASF